MRLLDKYLFRELLPPFGYCLGGFVMISVIADLGSDFGQFQEAKLKAAQIAWYYVLRLPEILALVIPIALLLALLYSLTHHSRHNELTAIRTAGVGLWRLSAPYFAVGIVLAVALFLMNEFWAPEASERAEQMIHRPAKKGSPVPTDQVRNLDFKNGLANRTWHIGLYNPKTAEMTNPQIDWVRPDGSRIEIFAARGWCSNNVWIFTTNAHTTNIQMNVYASGTGELLLRTNPPSFTAYDFDETPEQIKSEIYIASLSHNTRNVEIPLLRILNYLSLHPKLPRSEANWLYTQLHGRIAGPFTCLVVVLIAIPFGVSGGRRNVFVGVASSIFIVFAYFVLMRLCIAFGSRGWLAPWLAAWLPNLSFAAIALWLMRRVR